jgi:hypothetical protein
MSTRATSTCILKDSHFSPGPPVSSTNKTDRNEITETLLKVAFNTINYTKPFNLHHVLSMCSCHAYGWNTSSHNAVSSTPRHERESISQLRGDKH